MTTIHRSGTLLLWLLVQCASAAAEGPQLAPFKDALFAYPPLTATRDGGRVTDVAYEEMRDINGRDEVPERRVKRDYVDLAPLRRQEEAVLATPDGALKFMTVGERAHPSAILVFIHGRLGDRRLGMNDWTFGGNFNRLKNLMDRAGGLYVTADAGDFSPADQRRIEALLHSLSTASPQAPLVLACGSMGGAICWAAAGDPQAVEDLDGMVLLGANNEREALQGLLRAAGDRELPLVLAHGSADSVFPAEKDEALYAWLRKAHPGYPVRYVRVDGGGHGTPIRMIDWRETLNWIFAQLK
ncbi:alpha/beta hydrolase [Aurantimonas sp. MSK8Z-1]|uniref:alpha/beta hydrolase n=1 Tax=Mangrovibrevibacter kandeliae TaxID=2968473 RepID=UPI002117A5A5|nr:alpha/beta hydrolase [Aurantimonas sp. MSK8Z-1]MCW4114701.1 alpha/beta hydrolase [Aurantimonas sp. MSK8Z-1]